MRLRIGHEWYNKRMSRARVVRRSIEQEEHRSCLGEELRNRQNEAKEEPTEVEEEGQEVLFRYLFVKVDLQYFSAVKVDALFFQSGSEVNHVVVFMPVQVLAFEAVQRVRS